VLDADYKKKVEVNDSNRKLTVDIKDIQSETKFNNKFSPTIESKNLN